MRAVHDRMPVILRESDYQAWLDPSNERVETLAGLLVPFPAEDMHTYAINTRVNNARNDGPELVEPA